MKPTRELVDELRHDADKATWLSDAARFAYEQAAREYWERELAKKLGLPFVFLDEKRPLKVVIEGEDAQIIGLSFDLDGDAMFEVIERIKSGKWGKEAFCTMLNGVSKMGLNHPREARKTRCKSRGESQSAGRWTPDGTRGMETAGIFQPEGGLS